MSIENWYRLREEYTDYSETGYQIHTGSLCYFFPFIYLHSSKNFLGTTHIKITNNIIMDEEKSSSQVI